MKLSFLAPQKSFFKFLVWSDLIFAIFARAGGLLFQCSGLDLDRFPKKAKNIISS